MRDMVWIISSAHAVGMATSMVPPMSSQAATQRQGRMRLPPASSEYLMDSCRRSGYISGTESERACSMAAFFSAM